MITNIRMRLPQATFSGVSLNCKKFRERHGSGAFPLLPMVSSADGVPASGKGSGQGDAVAMAGAQIQARSVPTMHVAKRMLKSVPALWQGLKRLRSLGAAFGRQVEHGLAAYRFVRTQDLLIVSGGGQLDDEWGGAWTHPAALLKWAFLALIAGVPFAVASVGACKIRSNASRVFLSAMLRMSAYRSYRDGHSREIASRLARAATHDPVVPDLAYSLPDDELPSPAGVPALARGQKVVAVSPIAFARPGKWPHQNARLHERYLEELAKAANELIRRGYFLVIVCSSIGDDDSVVADLLRRLEVAPEEAQQRVHVPQILTWRDYVASVRDADFLISSRLHSTILGFVCGVPAVAISFDPKVDWAMEDLRQTDCLLQIGDFTAENVLTKLLYLEGRGGEARREILAYRGRALPLCARQYDSLSELAVAHSRSTRRR